MTYEQIIHELKSGNIDTLYEEGVLDVGLLRMAVDNGWLDVEAATNWYEVLMDI